MLGLSYSLAVLSVDEREVEELEKVFGSINDTKLCKLTRNGFGSLIGGAIADHFIDGLFRAFDENNDGLVDFKELVCGLSASCRGPHTARLNCEPHLLLLTIFFVLCILLKVLLHMKQ